MNLEIEVSAAVLNDSETKIGVRGLKQSGEDNAAGGDSVKNQCVNLISAKDHGEVVPVKALMRCLVMTISPSFGPMTEGIVPSGS